MKFKKKPVVIEAIQYTGHKSYKEMLGHWDDSFDDKTSVEDLDGFFIETLEGKHRVSINDWIIRGVKGEFYPCKPDIFEMTYEKAD